MNKNRERFSQLDRNKTIEDRAFYSSTAWAQASKHHRINNPLCIQCKRAGRITAATLVHHNPDRRVLMARGESPLDPAYFESLCTPCHNRELSQRQSGCDNSNSIDIVLGNQINVFKG
jgi:5-methylcytosine-specific restriction enzyme A